MTVGFAAGVIRGLAAGRSLYVAAGRGRVTGNSVTLQVIFDICLRSLSVRATRNSIAIIILGDYFLPFSVMLSGDSSALKAQSGPRGR